MLPPIQRGSDEVFEPLVAVPGYLSYRLSHAASYGFPCNYRQAREACLNAAQR